MYFTDIKNGVDISGLQWPIIGAWIIVASIFREMKKECTVTGGMEYAEGRSKLSKHWSGNALDFRTRHLDSAGEIYLIKRLVERGLGKKYSWKLVTLAGNRHLHIQFNGEVPEK